MKLSQRFRGAPPSAGSAGWVLLPLRGFLGVTFTFAGLQKLANPGFFDANNPTSIQQQLKESAVNSPVHALLSPLVHHAVLIGVLMALAELAVGIGTLLGLWTRIAAVGGILLSLALFLTVSFHSSPYYTGSDIVFLFAWLPVLVAGAGGVLSLDALIASTARPGRHAAAPPGTETAVPTDGRHEIDRRTFALKAGALGAAGALGVFLAGLASGLGRAVGHYANFPAAAGPKSLSPGTTSPGTGTTPATGSSTTAPAATHPRGTPVGLASAVAVGGAATFNDPKTGDPAVVVQPTTGTFVAFDAICPHEGCTVAYNTDAKLFICPCHGSRFNGETGGLVKGPAPHGLTPITIAEGPDGNLYAV
jgi:thiosulfate dehydrogenase [quinone] large subunit